MFREWLRVTQTAWKLALPLILIIFALNAAGIPQRVDLWIYDTLTLGSPASPSPDLELVAVDEKSLRALGRWPWPRKLHAELIDKLTDAGARVVVFDVLFSEQSDDDSLLANAMKRNGKVVLPVHIFPSSANQPLSEQLPTPPLTRSAGALGHAHVELDNDGIARGLYLYSGLGDALWPAISLAAARLAGDSVPTPLIPDGNTSAFVNVRSQYVFVPLSGRAGVLPTTSYSDILNGQADMSRFKDKVVFIGATAPGFGDVLPTPLSGLATPMSGVEFHANTYSAIAQQRLIQRLPPYQTLLLVIITIVFISFALPRLKPAHTLWVCLMSSALLLLFSNLLYRHLNIWVPISEALLVPLIAYPLWSTRRLTLLNTFLNRQLDLLGRDPGLGLREPQNQQPQRILADLYQLLNAEGCWLSQGDVIIRQEGLSAADIPRFSDTGRWFHSGDQSWIRISRGNRIFELGLILPQSLTREASRRYLQRLNLDHPLSLSHSEKDHTTEMIGARIERVRGAIETLTDMREFIGRGFERMPDGVIVTDALATIQFVNGHIEEWFGEPRPSLIGMSLTSLLNAHDPRESSPWQDTIADTLTLRQTRTVDLRVKNLDLLIHLAPFSMSDSDQHGIIANISNISELREQQRQHREAIDFISHDVRSPLVSQLALIAQLKRSPESIGPDQLEQLGNLARRSYQLAEEFVQLARAEQLTETRFYDCEFLSVVENARDSVSEQALSKGIHLELNDSEDFWLRGNAELLERAIINLLTNAVQYSPSGSTVNIQVFRAGHQVCLTVTDEGSGIAKHELPHLFDRYRRQKSSELSGNRGAGLGLSFVKVVVDKHRGEIEIVSAEGEGSAFTLRLPIADPLAMSEPTPSSSLGDSE
ncbi:MAG: histidine kinase [Alteromonadaceae bacterium]|nr:histidine kinase [Alteromonadaceae bacterium]MBH85900.1 histidine kinase [Alteromonadaceae bacterium]|tara:strand:+ start:68898 stop:71528 length:2631 start_codon:yes stop_codon:yes gene_type:complete